MTTAARRAPLIAAPGFLEIHWRGVRPDAAGALERRLHSWTGFGAVIVGMNAQGFDVELRQRGDRWRATFYPVGLAHSICTGRRRSRRRGGPCSGRRGRR